MRNFEHLSAGGSVILYKMKKLISITGLIFLILIGVFQSCKKAKIPVLTTSGVTGITGTSAVSGGTITSEGSGKISDMGICWSTDGKPTIMDFRAQSPVKDTFSCNLTSLTPGMIYYVRAYATNKAGTGYGDVVSFTTLLADADGNIYTTITIGTQIWMVENLKTTRFNDGAAIPLITSHSSWPSLSTPGYSWYNNDETVHKEVYGALYNWYSVQNGKLCPVGWHVPSFTEWGILSVHLTIGGYGSGGSGDDIAKSMAAKTSWLPSNEAGTIGNDLSGNNSSGFTALPGGIFAEGRYYNLGQSGNWWSATGYDNESSRSMQLNHSGSFFEDMMIFKNYCGLSVRCVKNQ